MLRQQVTEYAGGHTPRNEEAEFEPGQTQAADGKTESANDHTSIKVEPRNRTYRYLKGHNSGMAVNATIMNPKLNPQTMLPARI